ncbi:hypothetical protein ACFL5Y_01635 [Candidatus Omnitrophota bacterium]
MKKTIFMLIAAVIGLQMAVGPGFTQYITESIPGEDKIRSIEVVEIKRKVKNAKDLIEKNGKEAFGEFRREDDKWLGSESAIFIVEATEGSENKGLFVLYPEVETVGHGALDMRTVNGRHFVRKAVEKSKEEDEVWFGFVAGEEGKIPYASTIAFSPDGRHYAIAAGGENLSQEQHFLIALVNAACDLVVQEGEKAFSVFMDKDSIFRFKGSYIYVFDIDENILLNPEHPDYVGMNMKDYPMMVPGYKYPVFSPTFAGALQLVASGAHPSTREEYIEMRDDILIKNGFAWTAYLITKPGQNRLYRKVSYDKVVKGPDGKEYMVGSGVYVYIAELSKKQGAGDKNEK